MSTFTKTLLTLPLMIGILSAETPQHQETQAETSVAQPAQETTPEAGTFLSMLVKTALKKQKLHFKEEEPNHIVVGFSTDKGTIGVFIYTSDEEKYIHIISSINKYVIKENFGAAFPIINECNIKYSLPKFFLDPEDGQIMASYYMNTDGNGVSQEEIILAVQMLVNTLQEAATAIMEVNK